jgi:hypothetical protein
MQFDDELPPSEWLDAQYAKSPFSGAILSDEQKQFLEVVLRTHGRVPLGAQDTVLKPKRRSDLLESNIRHQKQFMHDILVGDELKTWSSNFLAITPGTTFEAFASAVPRGDDAILLTAPVFVSCSNFCDFLVWRFSQHDKRLRELTRAQLEEYSLQILHVCGAILGLGTLCPEEALERIKPRTEGAYLAQAAGATSMLFFIIAHEFAHKHLAHSANVHARLDGTAEMAADDFAVRLLARHIYLNGPKMGVNPSVAPMMLLAPFAAIMVVRILINSKANRKPLDMLHTRFLSLRERFHALLLEGIGPEAYSVMESSLHDHFFLQIPDIAVGIQSEEEAFTSAIGRILKEVSS